MKNKYVVILVEGETDRVFYKALIDYYRANSINEIIGCEVYSVGGFGNFAGKAISKLKNGIKPKIEKSEGVVVAVACAYDTDVFEYAAIPPIDWLKVKRGVRDLGVERFIEIKAKQMIEDWFLKDIEGLCSFLKIKYDGKSVVGKDGAKKMQTLFKQANKVYQKGRYSQKFIDYLNIGKIRVAISDELSELEKVLNVKIA